MIFNCNGKEETDMILLCFILILLLILALTALSLILHDLKIMNEQMAYKKKANAGFDVCVHSSSKTVVSLQKKINELYEQLAEAEINKLKKEQNMQKLLTNVSHDIRTPLTSIKGYVDLIKKGHADRSYLHIIDQRLTALKELLDDLFLYAKISDDDFSCSKESVALYPLLCKTLASYYYDFEQKNIVPEISFEDPNLTVSANRELLSSVFHNLISNALKYGQDHFVIFEKNGILSFCNPCGNAKQIDIDHLFDRLYHTENILSADSNRLGLSIVYKIILIHGWELKASVLDDTFSICINFSE